MEEAVGERAHVSERRTRRAQKPRRDEIVNAHLRAALVMPRQLFNRIFGFTTRGLQGRAVREEREGKRRARARRTIGRPRSGS